LGIDSISLNPDAVLKTTLKILELETRRQHSQDTVPAHVNNQPAALAV
jgi:hypothetical protein